MTKLVGNLDTSVLVGQLSSMIGQDLQWTVTTSETDDEGNVQKASTTVEGKVTGVSISDGEPTVIANANGKTYQVAIGDITRVGQGLS